MSRSAELLPTLFGPTRSVTPAPLRSTDWPPQPSSPSILRVSDRKKDRRTVAELRARDIATAAVRDYHNDLEPYEAQAGIEVVDAPRADVGEWPDTVRGAARTPSGLVCTMRVFLNGALDEEFLDRSLAVREMTP